MGMNPDDYWNYSLEDTAMWMRGFRDRQYDAWQQTRLIAYTIAATVTEKEKRPEIEDFLPLPGDRSPEERKQEKMKMVEGMKQLTKDVTARLREHRKKQKKADGAGRNNNNTG